MVSASVIPPHISVGDTVDLALRSRRRFDHVSRPAEKVPICAAHYPVDDAVRLAVPACRGVSGDDALDDLVEALGDPRGLAVCWRDAKWPVNGAV
jgi:hypothetical protein